MRMGLAIYWMGKRRGDAALITVMAAFCLNISTEVDLPTLGDLRISTACL